MAAAAKRSEKSGISWINSVSEEEQPLVFVPGVDRQASTCKPFNVGSCSTGIHGKKGTKTRIKRISDSKTPAIQKTRGNNQIHVQSDHSESSYREKMSAVSSESYDTFVPFSQAVSDNKAKSDICLKDLCPEDKRRIANLIEELARVTEEKEESVQRLKDEQGSSERKIQQLEEQNLTIARERESLQQQYKECQELLALYQQYLLLQQSKLNQSIPQPAPQSRVLSSEETHSRTSTSRANGSVFDGSYLGSAATMAQQSQPCRNSDRRRGAAHTFQSPAHLCCASDSGPNCGPFKQHMGPKRECREPHLCRRCENSQSSVHDTGYETQQQRSDSHQWNSDHYINSKEELERHHRGNIQSTEAKEAPSAESQPSHEDWEVKKHQILLQKLQLEMEREQIQARLAEQEERLKRQAQQQRQPRLDYSSFQQATRAELSMSNTRDGSSEPGGPSQEHLPPSVSEDVGTSPPGQSFHEKHSQTVSSLQNHNTSSKQARRDMATSPAQPPAGLTSASAAEQTPEARLDLSVAELLDIFSPVSTPEPCKPAAQRHKTSQRKPAVAPKSLNHALLTPGGPYPRSSQQDLEESQILEDIFFIF
ncbi:protein hinderin [Salarias fasciatus]|uniref:Protein hinderin n=1 Tax=Salarias fasciatus TaxID=181472 RepID=A0A672HBM0_SALFA|nr:protein hinderin [Salarias fasciatus]